MAKSAAARTPRIEDDVLAVLGNADAEGNSLRLVGQLDRKLYVRTNEVLEAAGGKWNKKVKAHVFEGDAAEAIDGLILTGQYTRAADVRAQLGFFETPPELAQRLVEMAGLTEGDQILEPSAGRGAIAMHIPFEFGNTLVEIDPARAAFLRGAFPALNVVCADFLEWSPGENLPVNFDRIIMNPPFAGQADIRHITHAFHLLTPGGRLVAIASASVAFRTDRRATAFRELVAANGGHIEPLPEGSFKASGTTVNTVIVTMGAP